MVSDGRSRVDLRSDTVTQPTDQMRDAIRAASVGDDVLGDDPTVQALEERVAAMCGMEAALFMPSGTMANTVAVRAHTQPGDEIVLEREAHIYQYEGGGFAAISGCSVALVDGDRGRMQPSSVASAIRKAAGSLGHYPDATLICVENTANRGGGVCYDQGTLDAIVEVGRANGCALHVDGARLMNAAVATSTSPSRMLEGWDSVSICLSKGLGAPVGSVLAGSTSFIARAHRWRKMLGGGMRQAGVLAAAGWYALDHHVDRLVEDHARARSMAEAMVKHGSFDLDLEAVQTNMVYFAVQGWTAEQTQGHFANAGIDVLTIDDTRCRLVTHLHITDGAVARVEAAVSTVP